MVDTSVLPFDPSKNVGDLVEAAEKFQTAMREAETRRQDDLSAAETRRANELANQRDNYETRIASMLADSVKSTSQLVSDQLAQQSLRFDTRISELERFRYESSGKTSATDPALAAALAGIASGMAELKSVVTTLRATDDMAAGGSKGRTQIMGNAFTIIGIAIAAICGFGALLLEITGS